MLPVLVHAEMVMWIHMWLDMLRARWPLLASTRKKLEGLAQERGRAAELIHVRWSVQCSEGFVKPKLRSSIVHHVPHKQ